MSPHPPHFSCIIHRLIDTRLKDDSLWETMHLCIHCQWKMWCPCFFWRLYVEEWNKQQGGSSESYNTGQRERGKQSTIGSNFVRFLFKILHQSFWWRGWWPPLSSYDLDETSHVTFATLCSHCIVNLCVRDILFYLIRSKPEPTTARLPCPLLCIHPVFSAGREQMGPTLMVLVSWPCMVKSGQHADAPTFASETQCFWLWACKLAKKRQT